jgi:hypothetical protein
MVLIFQSFWVALTGFWRYLIVFPFLTALLLILSLAAVFILPAFLLPLVPGALAIFMFLVAIRTALASINEYHAPSLGLLIRAAAIFTVFESILILSLGWTGIFAALVSDGFSLDAIFNGLGNADGQSAGFRVGSHNPFALALMALIVVSASALHVALMVPMAASAWSANSKGQELDIFWGFGASFLPLAAIFVMAVALQLGLWGFATIAEVNAYAIGSLSLSVQTRAENGPIELTATKAISGLLIAGLTYYWQATAAAMAFIKRRERLAANHGLGVAIPDEARVDPRSLRKAREQIG